MLRITTRSEDDELVLELEGKLTGVWVPELEAAWRQARASRPAGPTRVDLRAVDVVDDAGRYLLALMHESGARLIGRGCAMSELLREITGEWPARTAGERGRDASADVPNGVQR